MQGQSGLIGNREADARVRGSPGCCGFCFGLWTVTYQREAFESATFRRLHRPFLPVCGGGDVLLRGIQALFYVFSYFVRIQV
jgi:hypothetical protein